MKTHFKEQYALLEEGIKDVWDDCYVVLDANILLNFYRCSKDTSDDDTKDKQSRGERHVYDDLINWQMIINKAKNDGKNIVFVSGDQMEDWWDIWNGEKIRPRTELTKYFSQLISPKYGAVASYLSSIIPDSFSVLNESLPRSED